MQNEQSEGIFFSQAKELIQLVQRGEDDEVK